MGSMQLIVLEKSHLLNVEYMRNNIRGVDLYINNISADYKNLILR